MNTSSIMGLLFSENFSYTQVRRDYIKPLKKGKLTQHRWQLKWKKLY